MRRRCHDRGGLYRTGILENVSAVMRGHGVESVVPLGGQGRKNISLWSTGVGLWDCELVPLIYPACNVPIERNSHEERSADNHTAAHSFVVYLHLKLDKESSFEPGLSTYHAFCGSRIAGISPLDSKHIIPYPFSKSSTMIVPICASNIEYQSFLHLDLFISHEEPVYNPSMR